MEEQNLPADKNYTTIRTLVGNEKGLDGRPCMIIAKECFMYGESRDITVKRFNDTLPGCSCRSVMGMLTLEALKGTELEIKVNGTDDLAKAIAKRMQFLFSRNYDY